MYMKKTMVHLLYFFVISLILMSCNKDLTLTPLGSVTDDAVFSSTDAGLMRAFVNNIYQGIPDGYNWSMLSSVTDESHMNAGGWAGMSSIMKSQLTPSNLSAFSAGGYYGLYNWASAYQKIRAVNLFFSKVDASPIDMDTKNELKGEVFFLRAYLYHNLVAMYGGVPIITKAYSLTDSFTIARDNYADCIEFISNNCDSAAKYLPIAQSEVGRATQGAALALKSRTLLYAASDLYNTPSNWSNYAHPELVGYTSASASERQARWQKAKDAAKAVIDSGQYSLYKPDPADQAEAADNYYRLFLSMITSEDIFSRYYTTNISGAWTTYNPGIFHNPCGYHGWGTEAPTQQMVDEYEMNDGSAFSWSNPAHAAAPYENRDPRFYATVLYDGAYWRTRPTDVSGDPYGKIQTGYFYRLVINADNSVDTILVGGLDTGAKVGGVDTWNASLTGYYLKKGVDASIDPVATKQAYPWRFMRYTEVLLNYAEACIGLGEETEARTYINKIRKRAGMPDISTTGTALVNSLQHERKIELAFEELRYFDIRRWMICDKVYEDVHGVNILYGTKQTATTTSAYGSGTPIYSVTNSGIDTRAWDPKSYFLPITIDEMNKNYKLVQNPGYE
jgi:hypothetical protein